MSRHYAIRGLLQKYSAFIGCKNYSTECSGPKSREFTHPVRRPSNRLPRKGYVRSRAKKKKFEINPVHKDYLKNTILVISNILRYSSWESAQEQLRKFVPKWDSYTVNQVLKSHPPMEKAWLFFNWIPKDKGYKHDKYTYTTMLDIFGEAGRINSMMDVLQTMQAKKIEVTAVTYTSVLHWLAKSGDFDGAMKVWEDMKAYRCYPTVVSYTAYMKVLFDNNRAAEAIKVYKEMLEDGLSPTCHTYTVLMVHLISSGKYKNALEVFANLQEAGVTPDKAMCNILVEEFCKAGKAWAVIHILHYMKENIIILRFHVYLKAHETLKIAGEDDMLLRQVNPHTTLDVFDESVALDSEKIAPDVNAVVDKGLLNAFLRKKNFAAIDRLFAGMVSHNELLDPEIVSEIIEVNCNHARTNAALMAFEYSKNMGIQIEQVAYLSLIGILIRTNELSKILPVIKEMVNFKSFLDPAFAASLIYRLGQIKELDLAISVFDLFPKEIKSTAAYTALIDACFSAGFPDKGLETFIAMTEKGIQCVSATYNVLIKGLEICGRHNDAKICLRKKIISEKKYHDRNTIMLDEKICDALFAGYMVP